MVKILVVEDDRNNAEILRRLFSRHKYEVEVAENGQDAIAIATSSNPDLVLMDITIPNVPNGELSNTGGHDATKAIKEDAATRCIPVLAMTASVMNNDKQLCVEAGCDAVLSKPYKFADLLLEIERHLNQT